MSTSTHLRAGGLLLAACLAFQAGPGCRKPARPEPPFEPRASKSIRRSGSALLRYNLGALWDRTAPPSPKMADEVRHALDELKTRVNFTDSEARIMPAGLVLALGSAACQPAAAPGPLPALTAVAGHQAARDALAQHKGVVILPPPQVVAGSDATSAHGVTTRRTLVRDFRAGPEEVDRRLRAFKAELEKTARAHKATLSDAGRTVKHGRLTGFHFRYHLPAAGGEVHVRVDAGKPRRLTVTVEETEKDK
jgi:hypothetical protein